MAGRTGSAATGSAFGRFGEPDPAHRVAGSGKVSPDAVPGSIVRVRALMRGKENAMQGLDQILGSSGVDLGGLGARFGLSPEQTRSAMGSLMPAVVGGFHKQAQAGDPAGVAEAADAVVQPDAQSGNDILGRIFGSKDVSRQVADHAAGESGVSSTVLKAMLPVVAAMVARHVAGNGGGAAGGGLGGMLASVLGGGGPGAAQGLPGLGGLLGGGANPLDNILGGLRR